MIPNVTPKNWSIVWLWWGMALKMESNFITAKIGNFVHKKDLWIIHLKISEDFYGKITGD